MNSRWLGIILLVVFAFVSIIYSVYIEAKKKNLESIRESFSNVGQNIIINNSNNDNIIKNDSFKGKKNIKQFVSSQGDVNIIPMNNPGNSSYVLKLTNNTDSLATYTLKVDNILYKNKYVFALHGWGKDNSGNKTYNLPVSIILQSAVEDMSSTSRSKLQVTNLPANNNFKEMAVSLTPSWESGTNIIVTLGGTNTFKEFYITNIRLYPIIPGIESIPVADNLRIYLNVNNSYNPSDPSLLKDLSRHGNDFTIDSKIKTAQKNYLNLNGTSILSDVSAHNILNTNRNKAIIPFTIIYNIRADEGLTTTNTSLSIEMEKEIITISEEEFSEKIFATKETILDTGNLVNVLSIPGNNATSLELYINKSYGKPIIKLAGKINTIKYNIFSQEDNYFTLMLRPSTLTLPNAVQTVSMGYELLLYLNDIQIASIPTEPLYFDDNPIIINKDGKFQGNFYSFLFYDSNLSPNQIAQTIEYLRRDKLSLNNTPANQSPQESGYKGTIFASLAESEEEMVINNNNNNNNLSTPSNKNCPDVYYKKGRYWINIPANSSLAKQIGYCGERDYGRARKNAKMIFETNFPNCPVPTILSGNNYEGDMGNCPFIIHRDNPCSYDECRNVDWSKSQLNLSSKCKLRVNHYCTLNNKLDPACVCWRKENMKSAKCRDWRSQFEDPKQCDLGRNDISEHPDFNQYIKKDKIPCWNCNLNTPSYGLDGSKCNN
jgi:hypothetical protein